jgi:hypothetical protein
LLRVLAFLFWGVDTGSFGIGSELSGLVMLTLWCRISCHWAEWQKAALKKLFRNCIGVVFRGVSGKAKKACPRG